MNLPCEYCHKPVDAEVFMRLCVPPCCSACSWIPAVVGIGGLLLMVAALIAFAVDAWVLTL